MRLIDADKFKENILSGLYVYCQENKEDIARAIDDEPTIEPDLKLFKEWKCADCEEREKTYNQGFNAGIIASKPHGTWLYKEYSYYCSCCNKSALKQEDYPYLSAYCPFCGAKMEIPT